MAENLTGVVDTEGGNSHDQQAEASSQVGRYLQDFVQILDGFTHYLRNTDATQIKNDVRERVRENPLGTIAVGIGIGFLLGKIFR
jgi:ElaB/YqjD/DUF883 family membrane-anchored ribosome-binding protein